MRVFRSLEDISAGAFAEGSAVAIGKFDGIHLGHRALLDSITEASIERGLESVVFTFEHHPLRLLRPDICPVRLMSPEQRLDAIAEAGISTCVMVPFDEALSLMSAEEFVERVLVEKLCVEYLSLGADFRFGHESAGDAHLLERAGERFGFAVDVVPEVIDPELGRVSTSRVREAILQGDVANATRMLGRPPAVRGSVVHGDARGRELGFPTANLGAAPDGAPIEGLIPADGVYAGWAIVGGRRYEAAVSVGVNLTFEIEGEPRVEAHLIDFAGDLYGEQIEILFVERLRGMVAFAGIETLVERIREDVRETRVILAGHDAGLG